MGLNKPSFWTPRDLDNAFDKVGGQDRSIHLAEPRAIAALLVDSIPHGGLVVELGCGFGRVLKEVYLQLAQADKPATLVGYDFNPAMLDLAATYTAGLPISYALIADRFPAAKHSVDFIYSHVVMIHNDTEQLRALFRQCALAVKPGGRMNHDFLNGDNPEAMAATAEALRINFPLYPYRYDQIRAIAEGCGFTVLGAPPTLLRCRYEFLKI